MNNYITVYRAGEMKVISGKKYETPPKINDSDIRSDIISECISNSEKGGIYYNGYFYTSCLIEIKIN